MKENNVIVSMKEFSKKYGIHFTTEMRGKLKGMYSLSTCCECNKYCLARMNNPDFICHECFAHSMNKAYKENFTNCFVKNTEILTREIIPYEDLPTINVAYFRYEAFADLNNEIQFINYLNIAKKNKHCTFAIWTKNPFIMHEVFKAGYKKPKNMIIGISSYKYNTVLDVSKYEYFTDFVFTVYTKQYALENNIDINCGNNQCLNCLKCYKKHKGIIYVNEIVKREQKAYYKALQQKVGR